MPLTPIDANTVQDENGNQYFFPFAGMMSPDAPAPAPDAVSSASPAAIQPTLPSPFANLPAAMTQGPQPDLLNGGPSVPPDPNAPPIQYPPAQAQPNFGPTQRQQTADQARNNVLGNDVAAFAQAGGTPRSDADIARMVGGQAAHEAETAKADLAVATGDAQGKITKDKVMSDLMLGAADEYEKRVTKIDADAQTRFDDWRKRNQQLSDQLVDPRHAFSSMTQADRIGWALDFIGAGLAGGGAVDKVSDRLNKMVEQDIGVQKTNLDNRRAGLQQERLADTEQTRLSKDALADWYQAKSLRFTAVGKQLDAKIAEMGLPAAQAAGLLHARDLIEKSVIDNEKHMGDHVFEDAQRQKKEAHEDSLERLKSSLKEQEDLFKAGIKEGGPGPTLPTGTDLGLQSVNKATGQAETGTIPLKPKLPADKVVEAGQIMNASNQEATLLRDAQSELSGMSEDDLARGGSAKFKAIVKNLIQAKAVRDNGHRISDDDVKRAAVEEFGVYGIGTDSVIRNKVEALKNVGDYKQGILKTIDYHLRNLSKETQNHLAPYIDSDYAQTHDIKFNPVSTHSEPVSDKPDDLNTAITKAANGGNVQDVLAPGPRPPVAEDVAAPLDWVQYANEKEKGRGVQGGLPNIPEGEEAKVKDAETAFSHSTADDIISLSKAYLRDPKLSEEAKHEIRSEAANALLTAGARERAAFDEAVRRYQYDTTPTSSDKRFGVGPSQNSHEPAFEDGKPSKEFQNYLDSGILDELRKRAGLEPRVK